MEKKIPDTNSVIYTCINLFANVFLTFSHVQDNLHKAISTIIHLKKGKTVQTSLIDWLNASISHFSILTILHVTDQT